MRCCVSLAYRRCFVSGSAEKCEKIDGDEQIMFCHRRKLESMYADDGMWFLKTMRLVDAS